MFQAFFRLSLPWEKNVEKKSPFGKIKGFLRLGSIYWRTVFSWTMICMNFCSIHVTFVSELWIENKVRDLFVVGARRVLCFHPHSEPGPFSRLAEVFWVAFWAAVAWHQSSRGTIGKDSWGGLHLLSWGWSGANASKMLKSAVISDSAIVFRVKWWYLYIYTLNIYIYISLITVICYMTSICRSRTSLISMWLLAQLGWV